MVILGPVKDHGGALECLGIVRVRKIALAKLVADHACLHDRAVEEITAQNDEARLLLQGPVKRADYILIFYCSVAAVLADGSAVRRDCAFADQAVLHQLRNDRGYTAGAEKIFSKIFARRLEIDEQRHIQSVLLPVVDG